MISMNYFLFYSPAFQIVDYFTHDIGRFIRQVGKLITETFYFDLFRVLVNW